MSDARVRTSIIGVVVFALFSALFARLWYLQVAAADQFHAAATSNAVREIRESAPRGRILDAQGNVLADNRVENDITVDRKISAADKKRVLKKLSLLLSTPVKQLEVNLKDPRISPYTPVPVATDVAYDKLAWVAEHKEELPGVRADAVPVRQYPHNSLASHVLGYVGEINESELKSQQTKGEYALGDTIGKSGVELSYESDLRGRAGVRRVEVDATGRVIRTISSTPPVPGHDIRLTLDLAAQQTAETALAQGLDVGASRQGHELQAGLQDAGRAGGVRRGAGCDHGLGRRHGVQPELRPERLRARNPGVDLAGVLGQGEQLPARRPGGGGPVRTRFHLQARDCDRRAHVGRHHPQPDDQRSRPVCIPHGSQPVLQRRQQRGERPSRPEPGAHGVERRVLLHRRWRAVLPLEARPAGWGRAPGRRAIARLRVALGNLLAQRGHGTRAGSGMEEAGARGESRGVPVP